MQSPQEHMIFQALVILATELQPAEDPVLSSTTYRRQLALGLFYKVTHHLSLSKKVMFSSSSTCWATPLLQQSGAEPTTSLWSED